jgi:hypothetical protein
MLSILFHLVLLVGMESQISLELPDYARETILLRAAIFPLLACLGAACTASSEPGTESPKMVHFPTESDVTALTD